MQLLNASPRDQFTEAQVTALLQSASLQADFGVELLDGNDVVVSDISADVTGGEVARSNYAVIHGTCKLDISRALQWGAARVRPYQTLTGAGITARWRLGVFILTTPDRPIGETPATYQTVGYDKLYLLNQVIGDAHTEVAGAVVLDQVKAVITASGAGGAVLLDSTAATKTLASDIVWTLDEQNQPTWLRVVNDLLATVAYRGLWVNQDGAFCSGPYAAPADRPIEAVFSADDPNLSLVGVGRVQSQDLFPVPNWWRFILRGAATAVTEGAGQYTYQTPDADPSSAVSLGYTKRSVVFLDAADQASLVAQGTQIVTNDRQVRQTLNVTTAPWPGAGHFDVYTYTDAAIGGSVRVQEASWTMPLNGSDVTHVWEVVS